MGTANYPSTRTTTIPTHTHTICTSVANAYIYIVDWNCLSVFALFALVAVGRLHIYATINLNAEEEEEGKSHQQQQQPNGNKTKNRSFPFFLFYYEYLKRNARMCVFICLSFYLIFIPRFFFFLFNATTILVRLAYIIVLGGGKKNIQMTTKIRWTLCYTYIRSHRMTAMLAWSKPTHPHIHTKNIMHTGGGMVLLVMSLLFAVCCCCCFCCWLVDLSRSTNNAKLNIMILFC